MEQHRTRPSQAGPRRGVPPLPPQAGRDAPARPVGTSRPAPPKARAAGGGGPRRERVARRPAAVRRPAGPPPASVPQLPNPRLTGLGGGLFCAAVMLVLAFLDRLLLGGSLTVYGVLFLPVCALTALWVRPGDLVTAPVVVPIAFAVGLLPVAEGEGIGPRLMGLFTALATQAGWLYGGTLVAGSIATVRKLRFRARQATANRRRVAPGA
ncbi:DUF6542 domain-containing protein [Streptomyces sp. NPDC088387]|uniref:DUF6542 domain-containing protein n=1 Tax=Streptomyces sp. NPDC088387 TaxID=3365859 RepID=UPI0037FE93D7